VAEGAIADPWVNTSAASITADIAECNAAVNYSFSNLCVGQGNGHSVAFWAGVTGRERIVNTSEAQASSVCNREPVSLYRMPCCNAAAGCAGPTYELQLLNSLRLRLANGSDADFAVSTAGVTALQAWLSGAEATNQAYALSAQLAAMVLSVKQDLVNKASIIYSPGCGASGVDQAFITVQQLVETANAALADNAQVPAGNPQRARLTCLTQALERANNNVNFVQPLGSCSAP